ncbi:unnamed protein product [Zymoseptoria tritici ST99CH_3D7]|uniref:Uncharacterized protein n=2 Tax=Zymoseptoria tritici TaxID=1047171 RepID=A0A1X7SA14_ZYMT9|nr:unnamed protein product [Zymoseptoria tritici ST99CH_3D7]SMR62377.1 unnamed protein product [Zymoseptoria tritici ST99CH_1E4]
MPADDLATQRALFSRYHALLDTETLLTAQHHETTRRTARLAQRKARLLSTREDRQEYVSNNVLVEIARALNLEAEERALKGRDRTLRMKLGEVREEMGRFRKEKRRGYWRLHCQDSEAGWSAKDRIVALGILVALLYGLAWACK